MAKEGRPTVMTEEVVLKLEEGFMKGLSDRECSLYANISPSSLYDYCEKYPEFSERKELLKESVKLRAKLNIARGVEGELGTSLSQWYLERRDREFNPRHEVDVTTQGEKINNSAELKDLTQKLNELYRSPSSSGDGGKSSVVGDQTQD